MADRTDQVERNRKQGGAGLSDFSLDRYRHVGRHIPKDARSILDVGCNVGICAEPLRRIVPDAKLIGLDCVPERVAVAKTVLDDARVGFANELPFEDRTFCAVIGCEMIEHLTEEDARAFLLESARVLRPGGRLILTTPNPRYIYLRMSGRSVLDDRAHLTEFDSMRLAGLVKDAGLRVLCIEGTGRVSRYLGHHFPFQSAYGSYLIVAEF